MAEDSNEVLVAVVTLVLSFLLVLLSIAFGWYVMWKLFLSKFQFVRELLKSDDQEQVARHRKAKPRRD